MGNKSTELALIAIWCHFKHPIIIAVPPDPVLQRSTTMQVQPPSKNSRSTPDIRTQTEKHVHTHDLHIPIYVATASLVTITIHCMIHVQYCQCYWQVLVDGRWTYVRTQLIFCSLKQFSCKLTTVTVKHQSLHNIDSGYIIMIFNILTNIDTTRIYIDTYLNV